MFDVKWVSHRDDNAPIDLEKSPMQNLDVVVWHCIARISEMREEFSDSPPDGFVVFNDEGIEVRRWFQSARAG